MNLKSVVKGFKSNLISNSILILILLILIGVLVYTSVRLDVEGAKCVLSPITYYEELNNVTIPREIKQAANLPIDLDINFSDVEFIS